MSNSNRKISFDSVNILRAVICVGIMIRHFSAPQPYSDFWPNFSSLLKWIPGTECFLVVAGYLLAYTFRGEDLISLSIYKYIRRRLYRIVIPYWTALTLAYLLPLGRVTVYHGDIGDAYQPVTILLNYMCIQDIFGYTCPLLYFWTMPTVIQCYLGWAILYWSIRNVLVNIAYSNFSALTTHFLQWTCLILGFALGFLHWSGCIAHKNWEVLNWIEYPAIGALAYWINNKQIRDLLTIAIAIFTFWGYWASNSPRPLFGGATALLLAIVPGVRLDGLGFVFRAVLALGKRSFSIYLVHGLVGHRISGFCDRVGIGPTTCEFAALGVALSLLGSIIAGSYLYKLVEEPMAHLASKISYRS